MGSVSVAEEQEPTQNSTPETEPEPEPEPAPEPEQGRNGAEDPFCVGLLYVWKRGDPIPALEVPARFSLKRVDRPRILNQLSGLNVREIERRIRDGHVPYVAYVRNEPVASGWSAWNQAAIGELGLSLRLPRRNHYLWDFITVPEWRNRGVYRRMLQEILKVEGPHVDRIWVGHDIDNEPSGKGILSAGFTVVGEVWSHDGELMFAAHDDHVYAREAAALLRIPLGSTN